MYQPQPVDTSHIELPEKLEPVIEQLARHAHDVWALRRINQNWQPGGQRDDTRRTNPNLKSFDDLTDDARSDSRAFVTEVLRSLQGLGFQISEVGPRQGGDGESDLEVVEDILSRLAEPGTNVHALFHSFHDVPEHRMLWLKDVRLYQQFGEKLISEDWPTQAFDLVREGIDHHPGDAMLTYLLALSLSRGKNLSLARHYAGQLLHLPNLPVKYHSFGLCLLGRFHKDAYSHARTDEARIGQARHSAELYDEAFALDRSTYPGINAATMQILAGEVETARQTATGVVEIDMETHDESIDESQDYWRLATIGEAYLILDRLDEAEVLYGRAVKYASKRMGDIASMRGNVVLLGRCMELPQSILDIFDLGNVVTFSGHMIDHPDRPNPRFPAVRELEDAVADAISKAIDELHGTIAYCSAACGGDIIFAEQILDRGGELHVVLPFAIEDFYTQSVDFGLDSMADWRKRFDVILDRATQVHYATEEPYLGDDALFEYANRIIQGLALSHAGRYDTEPAAIALLDVQSMAARGGTSHFLSGWEAAGRQTRLVDIAKLRDTHCPDYVSPAQRSSVSAAPAAPSQQPRSQSDEDAASEPTVRIERDIRAMLFADVKNYSKLKDKQSPAFFMKFLGKVAAVSEKIDVSPVFRNTWGDALFMVFDNVCDCAEFALALVETIELVDWAEFGLPSDTTLRVGVHIGPVYCHRDPVINQDNFFGGHVNQTARIEPVTTPGCVFTTEQFAAYLAVEDEADRYNTEYLGIRTLPKGFGHLPLYLLQRLVNHD